MDLTVVPDIFDDFMTGFAQQSDFRFADGVLSATMLIEVVRDEDFHERSLSNELANGRFTSPLTAGFGFSEESS